MPKPGEIVRKFKDADGGKIVIRYPKMSDAETARDFINKLSKERTYLTVQGNKISLKEESKWLASKIKARKEKKCAHIMAFHGKTLIGGADIDLRENIKRHVGVFGIAIAKNYRGMGLGKLLMKLVLQEAKKNLKGLKIVILDVFAINKPARNLYKKMGFKECGLLPGGIAYKGKYVDDVLMYKKI